MSSVSYTDSPGQQIIAVPSSYTLRWLRGIELPNGQFLVPGRIPYGIWSHAAPAGGYKSAFAAQIEHHISFGTKIPGLDWEFAQQGDCLVITPDESIYEVQARSLAILPGGELASDGLDGYGQPIPGDEYEHHHRHVPEGHTLSERIGWMVRTLEEIEAMTGRKIVWIRWDTIGSLLGTQKETDAYSHAMPLQTLGAWLASTGRVLFLPNHIGKDGRSIGTVGVDGSSNLKTEAEITRASYEGTLSVTKMRGGRPWEAALTLRDGLLELEDLTPQQASHGLGTLPRMVCDFLAAHGPSRSFEIIQGAGIERNLCWRIIMRLKNDHEIRNVGGVWSLTDTGRSSDPPEKPSSLPHDRLDGLDTLDRHDRLDAVPAPSEWTTCAGCGSVIPSGATCQSAPCQNPPAAISIAQAHRAVEIVRQRPVSEAEQASEHLPKAPWRSHTQRGEEKIDPPEVDATWHMDGDEKIWNTSPISAAIDLVMADRDAGKLKPTWRCELPGPVQRLMQDKGIEIVTGIHGHGQIPVRKLGQITAQPPGPWVSYDVVGSFLAAYKTHLAVKPLTAHEGEWTPKAGGLLLVRTPAWDDKRIGHPFGNRAKPGELQLIWQPTMRLAMKLAEQGRMAPPVIEGMWLRVGHTNCSEALFDGFYKRMRLGREHYPKGSDENEYIKRMYSQFVSTARTGRLNVFKREDWTGSIRAEAFGPRLWGKAYDAIEQGAQLWGMGNTDELCFKPNPILDTVFPQDDERIGKMKVKDWGGDR